MLACGERCFGVKGLGVKVLASGERCFGVKGLGVKVLASVERCVCVCKRFLQVPLASVEWFGGCSYLCV